MLKRKFKNKCVCHKHNTRWHNQLRKGGPGVKPIAGLNRHDPTLFLSSKGQGFSYTGEVLGASVNSLNSQNLSSVQLVNSWGGEG